MLTSGTTILRIATLIVIGAVVAVIAYLGVAFYIGGPAYASGEWVYWRGRAQETVGQIVTTIHDPIGDDEYEVLELVIRQRLETLPRGRRQLFAASTYWPPDEQGYFDQQIEGAPELSADFATKNRSPHAIRLEKLRPGGPVGGVPLALLATSNGKDRFNNRYAFGEPVLALSRVAFDPGKKLALVYVDPFNRGTCWNCGYYLLRRAGTGWALEADE